MAGSMIGEGGPGAERARRPLGRKVAELADA